MSGVASDFTDSDPGAQAHIDKQMIRQFGLEVLDKLTRTKNFYLTQARTPARDKAIVAMEKAIAVVEEGIA